MMVLPRTAAVEETEEGLPGEDFHQSIGGRDPFADDVDPVPASFHGGRHGRIYAGVSEEELAEPIDPPEPQEKKNCSDSPVHIRVLPSQ